MRERGLSGLDDYEHLSIAANEGRILVTHNREHFRLLHGAWLLWSNDWGVDSRHSGVLVIDQRLNWDARRIGSELDQFARAFPAIPNALYRRTAAGWTQISGH